jgi:nucleotide-binding universal stress UspA family protein
MTMGRDTITGTSEMLVPLDGREASLRSVAVAARIADRLGMQLQLFGVSSDPEEMATRLREHAIRLLPGLDVGVRTASGDPAELIVSEAGGDRLVCMATAATLRPHHGHLGSVAETVVRTIGRPVVLLGPRVDPEPGRPIDRVVIPVDGSDLSERAVDMGGDLARALGVDAWVVSVISPRVEASASDQLGGDPTGRESGYVRKLAERLSETHDIRSGFEVLHIADPAIAIVDFAGQDGAVVMSTHGRSGMSRLVAGSVALRVVAQSPRPVVVAHPSDVD